MVPRLLLQMWLLWGGIGIHTEGPTCLISPGAVAYSTSRGDGLEMGRHLVWRKVGVNRGWNMVLVYYTVLQL